MKRDLRIHSLRVDERCSSYIWSDFRRHKWPEEMHCAILSPYRKEDSRQMNKSRVLDIKESVLSDLNCGIYRLDGGCELVFGNSFEFVSSEDFLFLKVPNRSDSLDRALGFAEERSLDSVIYLDGLNLRSVSVKSGRDKEVLDMSDRSIDDVVESLFSLWGREHVLKFGDLVKGKDRSAYIYVREKDMKNHISAYWMSSPRYRRIYSEKWD